MENEVLNISIDELFQIENLSVRAKNVCEWNSLNDINSILIHYWEYGDFLKLRNCGQKSNIELVEVCKKYEKLTIKPKSENFEVIQTNPLLVKIESLTIRQKQIINNLLENQFKELSVRSSKALLSYLDSDISIKGIKSILSNQESEIRNLRNIGEKSIEEINSFINSVKENIDLVSVFENEDEITIELFNTFLSKKFSLDPTLLALIGKNYDFSYGLPIFRTLKILIENEVILDHREKEIFKSGFNYFKDSTIYTLDEIAERIDITRERTRQIRQKLYENLSNTLSFLRGLEFDAINLYGIDYNTDCIVVDEDIVNEVNKYENTDFNSLFINKVLSILLLDKYILIGNEGTILFNKNCRTEHNWYSTYLVSNKYVKQFDFDKFVNDVSTRLSQRIEEDYSFHFETYLIDFFKVETRDSISNISQIAEFLLLNEFELTIDTEDNIVFKRNIKKQVIDYVYEVLEEKNEPLTVYEIFEVIERKYPGITKSPESLRGSCQRDVNLIFFGRSSTYGLKKWEEELNIKGGTIRDIAEEFLQEQSEPKHIDDITEFVNQYRDTNSKNIYANLKMDESKRFVFYSGTYIGLTSKKYSSDEFIETKSIHKSARTWEESFEILKEFTLNNNRLPYSIGSEEEAKIYRFLNIQLRKDKNGELDLDKSGLLKDLVNKFPYKIRERHSNDVVIENHDDELSNDVTLTKKINTVSNVFHEKSITVKWWDSFEKLSSYLKINGQYPKATENRELYIFCYQCYKNLKSSKLQKEQVEALESIVFDFLPNTQNNWEDYLKELKIFYDKYQRWPKYNKSDSKESKLYRFCNSIFHSLENGELSINQQKSLEDIGFPLSQGYIANIWLDNYEKLKVFRQNNPNKWPKARGDKSEKPLYQFCYRNKNKFLEGSLEEFKVKLLNDINFNFYE